MKHQFKIVSLINECKVVMNAGENQGIKLGQRYLIYALSSQEIFDPDTHESLGFLEIVKGTGKVIHVQEKMCTLESDTYKISSRKITRKSPISIYSPYEQEVESEREQLPFEQPEIGDLAKRVN